MSFQRPNYPSAFLHPFSHTPTLENSGPVIIDHGSGIYVFDDQGRKYLEGNSGLWNTVLGFNNPQLIEAAQRAYAKLPAYHAFFGRVTQSALDLSERLIRIAPMEASRVFYANSGSEANDTVVKMLWMLAEAEGKPNRKLLLSRRNAYHGVTVMTASLTGKDYVKAFGLPLEHVRFLSCPHHWREGRVNETEEAFSTRLADELEVAIRLLGADNIAGFFAEPVMGAGGVIPPPAGYFQAMQPVLERYGIPLVADEVICGFGRTGELWGSTRYGITPDIVVASKVITAGFFPMGTVILSPLMTERLEKASTKYDEFPHGFTTGAHPVGCAIAMAVLDQLFDGGVLENIKAVAPVFQRQLSELGAHPMVGEARGVGLMGALDIVGDKATKQPYPPELEVSERIAIQAMKNGLIVRPIGTAVVLAPPFIAQKADIEELFSILKRTLDEVHASLPVRAA
jgi:4-aminobutyrate--pyruvate transaminase